MKTKVDLDEVLKYYSFALENSFDLEVPNLLNEISNTFFSSGMLADVKINEKDMKNFLISKKTDFDLLANQFKKNF